MPSERDQIVLFRSLICTGARLNPTNSSINEAIKKRRFAPPAGIDGTRSSVLAGHVQDAGEAALAASDATIGSLVSSQVQGAGWECRVWGGSVGCRV